MDDEAIKQIALAKNEAMRKRLAAGKRTLCSLGLDDDTQGECGISSEGAMADFESNKKAKVGESEPALVVVNVAVKRIDGDIVDMRELSPNTTVGELKTLISKTSGHPISTFSLAYGENLTEMDDAHSLAALGIETTGETTAEVIEVMMLIKSYDLESDKAALIAMFHSTNGAQWLNQRGWLTDAPVGEWYGVTVEGERVVTIELSENNLRGRQASV